MIPILNLAELEQTGPSDTFSEAYRSYGFCAFSNTQMDVEKREEGYRAFRKFFALPEMMKQHCFIEGGAGRRGYTPMRVETARQGGAADWKEFYHVGRESVAAEDRARPLVAQALSPNIWPEVIPEFRPAALGLYDLLEGIGQRVLRLMEKDLQLDEGYFAANTRYGNSILRALHYPPVAGTPEGMRAAPHEDISLITILMGATDAGLQVQGKDGEFIPVQADEEIVIVNVGDMLQRLTNGVYRSATHQVVNPSGEAALRPRYSVPFFLDPNPDFLIEALPSTRSNRSPQPPILAHDYLMERLREIKLA